MFTGVYPLFKRSAADLQGAALRVHITMTAGHREESARADTQTDSDSQEELLSKDEDHVPSPTTPRKPCYTPSRHSKSSRAAADITSVQQTEMSSEESFPVSVSVERAMHLNLKGEFHVFTAVTAIPADIF